MSAGIEVGPVAWSPAVEALFARCPWGSEYAAWPGLDAERRAALFARRLGRLPADALGVRFADGDGLVSLGVLAPLPHETECLGVRTARLECLVDPRHPRVAEATVRVAAQATALAREAGYRLLVSRADTRDLAASYALEEAGARLMESTTTWLFVRGGRYEIPHRPCLVRPLDPADLPAVERITRKVLRVGHYHRDPRVPAGGADAFYQAWIGNAAAGQARHFVVAELEGAVVGFLCVDEDAGLRELTGELGLRRGLSAADPPGTGAYRSIMSWLIESFQQAVFVGEYTTQIFNVPVLKVWRRIGLEPAVSHHTFHTWL